MKPGLLLIAWSLVMVGAAGEVARPCSPACGTSVRPAGGDVPANMPGVEFDYRGPPIDPTVGTPIKVTELLPGGGEAALAVTIERRENDSAQFARFARPLTEGANYRVEIANGCGSQLTWTTSEFHAVAAAPFPTSIGTVTVGAERSEHREVWTYSGSCTTPATIRARTLTLELAPDARPWVRALDIHWMDGEFFATGVIAGDTDGTPADAWRAWAEVSAYRVCVSDDDGVERGLKDGDTTLVVTASIAGSDQAIGSASANVALHCAHSNIGGCGAAGGDPALVVVALGALAVLGARRLSGGGRARKAGGSGR